MQNDPTIEPGSIVVLMSEPGHFTVIANRAGVLTLRSPLGKDRVVLECAARLLPATD